MAKKKYLASAVFDDTHELTEYLAASTDLAWTEDLLADNPGSGWTGTGSFDEALRFAREGWPEGAARIHEICEAMSPYVRAAVRLPSESLSPAGYAPNVAAFCAGSPACMYSTEGDDLHGRAPVVRFLVNIAANAGVSADALMRRGAALCAVVDYLEASGQTCEIQLVCRQDGNDCVFDSWFTIKRAGEVLDRDRMAFFMANPSVLRRFVFRLNELDSECFDHLRGWRGRAADVEPEHQQVYLPSSAKQDLDYECRDEPSALRYVLGRVQEAMNPADWHRVNEDWEQLLEGMR